MAKVGVPMVSVAPAWMIAFMSNEERAKKVKGFKKQALGAGGTLIVALCLTQVVTMANQWVSEKQLKANPIWGKMKNEQEWLARQGFGPPRRLLPPKDSQENSGPAATKVADVGGWDPSWMLQVADKVVPKKLLPRKWAIIVGESEGYPVEGSSRHEEGHARSYESPSLWQVKSLSGIGLAQGLIKNRMNSVGEKIRNGESIDDLDWRAQWMHFVRSEAFADAFSLLSTAKKEPGVMKKNAVRQHALRIAGGVETEASSLQIAGDTHAVEAASFWIAQLDEQKVRNLTPAGIDELASQIADATLEWTILRVGGKIGLDSSQSAEWFQQNESGMTEKDIQKIWSDWTAKLKEPAPRAVFGQRKWTVEGMTFIAQGLSEKNQGAWRYDGWGGLKIDAKCVDPNVIASLTKREAESQTIEEAVAEGTVRAWWERAKRDQKQASEALKGARQTHAELRKLVGMPARTLSNPWIEARENDYESLADLGKSLMELPSSHEKKKRARPQ